MTLDVTPHPWQQQLKTMIKTAVDLFDALRLPQAALAQAQAAERLFPVRATHSYLNRIEKGNLSDPLLLQILPLGAECTTTPDFTTDPLAEKEFNPLPGLLHKYTNRVLITLGACAIHCRYCFRRHFDYDANTPSRDKFEAYAAYIHAHPTINEVILSGGDPLMASDIFLHSLITLLEAIPHIKTLRFHSRLPIVLPARLTPDLLKLFNNTRLNIVLVTHANHPNEINTEVTEGLAPFKGHATLLNQSVILKGINDTASTLHALHQKLFDAGVLPYYLHLQDKVQGTGHFMVTDDAAIALYQDLHAMSSGYCLPKLVREIPGAPGKVMVC